MGFIGDAWDNFGKYAVSVVAPPVGAAIAADDLLNDGGVQKEIFHGGGDDEVANTQVDNSSLGIQGTPWGGYEGADQNFANIGMSGVVGAADSANWWKNQAQTPRGAMSWENQELSDREAQTRYGDQSGAIQLAREAAMGMAPSAAAYQMQSGLDQSLAAQQAQMGGARGAAGVALAGGNAAANSASLMNQTYNQAGQLRAQEMASAMGLYGGLSGQQRSQDLERLGQSTQNTQFNVGANDQYALGAGGVANQYGQQGIGWYGQSAHGYDQAAIMNNAAWDRYYNSTGKDRDRQAGIASGNADRVQRDKEATMRTVATGFEAGAKLASGA